jgi:opacity protein-like surface antigen
MKRTAMVGLLALASWSAQAAEVPGWRIGAAATFGDFEGSAVPEASLPDRFIEDNDVGFKLHGQYQLNDWLGIEAAYHDLGDFEEKHTAQGKMQISVAGFTAQGLLYIPVSDEIQVYAKAGYAYDMDEDLTVNNGSTSSDSENGFVWGGGASIQIAEHVGIRMDYDQFNLDVGEVWSVNLGVEYYFGGSQEEAAEVVTPPPPPPPPEPAAEPPPAEEAPAAEPPAGEVPTTDAPTEEPPAAPEGDTPE